MKNLFSLIFVILLCAHATLCDLRFVFSFFRHGARQPTAIKGGIDEFGESWSNPGELTATGKRMHFLLGLRNRHYYKNFTTKSRIDGSVYVRSTDYNRTIESVQSQMQGFFPPGNAELIADEKTRANAHPFIDDPTNSGWEKFNDFLGMKTIKDRVETIPIHLFTQDNPFNQFFYVPYICKPYKGMSDANIKKEPIQNFMKKFKEDYGEKLMKMTGRSDTNFLDSYWYLFGLFDSFISDMYDGRELKKPQDFGIDLQEFNKTSFEFAQNDILIQFNGDDESFFARWSMSILLPEVIQWMENRIAADKSGNLGYSGYALPRFAFFSTHDVTVGSGLTVLSKAFGFPLYYTPFACDIFMELHHDDDGNYSVHIKYQSLTLGVVPFDEFKSKIQALLYTREQIAETCGWDMEELKYFLPGAINHH